MSGVRYGVSYFRGSARVNVLEDGRRWTTDNRSEALKVAADVTASLEARIVRIKRKTKPKGWREWDLEAIKAHDGPVAIWWEGHGCPTCYDEKIHFTTRNPGVVWMPLPPRPAKGGEP